MIYQLDFTIGIPRTELPQIEDDHHQSIIDEFEKDNIDYEHLTCTCKELKPSQDELNIDKIKGMIKEGNHKNERTIFISEENFIVDGHHVWAARMLENHDMEIDCIKVDMNIIDLINWFNEKDFTYSKKITEGKKCLN